MSHLLEILGRATTVDTADLICHWLNQSPPSDQENSYSFGPCDHGRLGHIVQLIGEMKLDAAAEELRLHLFEDPACLWGRLAAAAICLHHCRLEEAIEELNSVYMRRPSNTMALYALGHCYERLGRESEAIEFYQDCLKFKNYLQLPAQRLAAIYLKNGQLQKTIQQYELLNEQHPGDMSTLVTLGRLYITSGEHAKAVNAFHGAILLHPSGFVADDRVDQLVRGGQLDTALERLERLLECQPERPDLIAKHGDVLTAMNAIPEALSQYQRAVQLYPDFLEATIRLGTCYLQMGAPQLAAQQFNKAVDINDQIVDAYLGLATAQRLSGHTQEALATLSLAASIQPNSSFLFAETAALLFSAAKAACLPPESQNVSTDLTQQVIRAHRQQIRRQPQNPDLHYRLGVLLLSSGKLTDAVQSFKTALHLNGTHTRAKSKLTICLFDTGRQQEALDHLTAESNPDKDTLALHYQTALLYCNRAKFASSLMNLDKYLRNNLVTTDPSAHIAVVLQNLGVLDRVAAMWENLSATADEALEANHA
ncbi:MAG: tetratricopeptide repeat protein [Phycisphaerales bacterium]|nr:MAG: tetratricopeptide repeat protein [Phycisphaerales bacterium]